MIQTRKNLDIDKAVLILEYLVSQLADCEEYEVSANARDHIMEEIYEALLALTRFTASLSKRLHK